MYWNFNRYFDEFTQDEIKNSPEKNLLISIVQRAMIDVYCGKPRWERDAINWLTSTKKSEFSYHWICSILQIDSVRLRDKILSAKRSKIIKKGKFRRLVRC